jgi:hypothetical protein
MNTFFIIISLIIVWVLENIAKTLERIENKLEERFPESDDLDLGN